MSNSHKLISKFNRMKLSTKTFFSFLFLLLPYLFKAQSTTTSSPTPYTPTFAAYIGVVHPLVTFQGGKTTFNFKDSYTVGFPTAVILRKSKNYAYSFEVIPFIKADEGTSKVSNVMIHPGVTFYLKHGFAITPRIGFETNGRYGFTFVFVKNVGQISGHPINVNIATPTRFGADQKASQTLAINVTFGF
jgi:hypothetical protein